MTTIYGIFIDNKCIYVGSTGRIDIEDRWKEHKKALKKGKHSNKTLQKKYDTYGDLFEYRIIKEIKSDNTLIKFFAESLVNSIYKPTSNKCIIAQGRMRVILQRCDVGLANNLLDVICNY